MHYSATREYVYQAALSDLHILPHKEGNHTFLSKTRELDGYLRDCVSDGSSCNLRRTIGE